MNITIHQHNKHIIKLKHVTMIRTHFDFPSNNIIMFNSGNGNNFDNISARDIKAIYFTKDKK